jgi:hypothetical protein
MAAPPAPGKFVFSLLDRELVERTAKGGIEQRDFIACRQPLGRHSDEERCELELLPLLAGALGFCGIALPHVIKNRNRNQVSNSAIATPTLTAVACHA